MVDGATTFRVEGSAGPPLPGRLKPRQTGDGCGFYVPPGPLTALVFERWPGSSDWYVGGCADAMLPSALHRILGDAAAVEGGAPAAYAAGEAELTELTEQTEQTERAELPRADRAARACLSRLKPTEGLS